MSFALKKFNFAHQIELIDHGFPQRGAICHSTSSPSSALPRIFVGCDNGSIHVLNENAQLIYAFPSHGYKVLQCSWLEPHYLVTIGSEEPGVSSTSVKLWDVTRLEALTTSLPPPSTRPSGIDSSTSSATSPFIPLSTPSGSCLRTMKLFSPPAFPESQATALDAISHGTSATIAVGLASGMIYTLTAELPYAPASNVAPHQAASKSSAQQKALMMQHVNKISARPDGGDDHWSINSVLFHSNQPSSALPPAAASKDATKPSHHPSLHLFVVTESQTLSFSLDSGLKTILDQQGGSLSCCTLRSTPLHLSLASKASSTALMSPRATSKPQQSTSKLLVVARDEGLYDYTPDTRGGCTVFEGTKQSLTTLQSRYLVVTSKEGSLTKTNSSEAPIFSGSTSGALSTTPLSIIQLVDCKNRLVAGTFSLQGVTRVMTLPWSLNDGVLVLCSSGAAYLLKLVDLSVQLESFYKRSLYKLALDVARADGASGEVVAGIQKLWGDHLYSRGEFEAAMGQYLDTLGHLEPSYVIRRYLDAQRTSNLTLYLEALHDKSLASVDHTTLLLNCYTKLKDVASLDAFIDSGGWKQRPAAELKVEEEEGEEAKRHVQPSSAALGSPSMLEKLYDSFATGTAGLSGDSVASPNNESLSSITARGGREGSDAGLGPSFISRPWSTSHESEPSSFSAPSTLRFDPETAFRVLFSAGYSSHALRVAQIAKNPEWILEVLLNEPEAPETQASSAPLSSLEPSDKGALSRRLDLQEAVRFLETLPRRQRAAALLKHGRVLIESHAEEATRLLMELCIPPHSPQEKDVGDPEYIASISDFALLYSTRPTALMLLCEFILASTSATNPFDSSQGVDSASEESRRRSERMLYHTLLDLYLVDRLSDEVEDKAFSPEQALEARLSSKRSRRSKALELLHSGWPPHLMDEPKYSPDQALILCRLQEFSPGLVFIYDRLGLFREVLSVHMAQNDHACLIEDAVKYGDASTGGDPQVWSELLDFFVAQLDSSMEEGKKVEEARRSILTAVEHIESGNILPPLLVLQALSKSSGTSSSSSVALNGAMTGKASSKGVGLCMGDVRGYIERQLERETSELESCRAQIERLTNESASIQAETLKLKTQPRIFQATRCSASGQPLELPIVHFYCGHSFNQKSLGDNESECPICAPDFKRVADIKRGMALSAVQQDRFFSELKGVGGADEGFSVIAEYLGRGVLNYTRI